MPVTKVVGLPGLPVVFETIGVGPAAWTPLDLGVTLKAWYNFENLAGADGIPIDTITDSSGNNFTATSPGGTTRATKAAAHQNGKSTLKFTGNNIQRYQLPSNFYGSASAASAYIVLQLVADPPAGGTVTGLWSIGSDAAGDAFPFTDGNIYCGFASTVRKACGNPVVSMAGVYRIYSFYSAANDWGMFIDGGAGGSSGGTTAFFSTATNTVGFDTTPWIGVPDALTAALDGWLADVIFTTAKQSTLDRQKMEGYLAWKWGLAGNLAAAHPYKSAPP
jgi:hypothetical protein